MWLSSEPDVRRRSLLAVRITAEPTERGLLLALFLQLGTVIARRAENLYLLRSRERAVRVRDDVMAVVSHDLRGPLSNALVACELLAESVADRERAVVERMTNGLSHMQRLVDDLVEAVRAERNDAPLTTTRVNARELVRGAADLVAEACTKAGVALDTIAEDIELVADPLRVAQVLANLLSNAMRVTPAGGRIEVAARVDGDDVLFTVTDSGPGVPDELAARIFDRFFTADHKRGLGLGLAIARSLVAAHGGRIWVERAEPGGARFSFTIPRAV
jgi:signal transduction histidine kinase